jgi:hypothetical protein
MPVPSAARTATGEFAVNHDGWHAANAMLLRLRSNFGLLHVVVGSEASVKVLISALGSEYGGTSDLARQALKRTLRKSSDSAVKRTIRDAGVN